jgi:hypothetical protein
MWARARRHFGLFNESERAASEQEDSLQQAIQTSPRACISRFMRNLDCQMRKRPEAGEPRAIIVRIARLCRDDRNNRPQMFRPQAPEMEIGEFVVLAFDGLAQIGPYAGRDSCRAGSRRCPGSDCNTKSQRT